MLYKLTFSAVGFEDPERREHSSGLLHVQIEAPNGPEALVKLGAALTKLAAGEIPDDAPPAPVRNNWDRLRDPFFVTEKAHKIAHEWVKAYFPFLEPDRREQLENSLQGVIEGAMKSVGDPV